MAGTSIVFDILAKDRASGVFSSLSREVDGFDKKLRGLNQVGDVGGKIALSAAAGLVAIVGVTANFEKAMSNVKAATGEGEAGMKALREAALQAGADTAFSASEAAGAIENLAKAGVSTQDILGGGLRGALDLAAAGEIDVAVAAEQAATAMTQFGLSGQDVPHIADLLAAAAGKAQGEVTDMGMALSQAGLVSDQVGLSIEETTGALGAFASAGLLGSDAGTSFKTMLGALTPNSEKAASAMKELGISAYDSQGNFVGLADFAGNLQAALSGLTDQQRQATLETIFGSDAVRAASILYEQGADGVQSWIDKVNDSGFAAEQAKTKLDNLGGDFEALMGSVETALIGSGEGSQGALRGVVQGITGVVNAYNNLPPAAQGATTGILGVTAVLGGGIWATSKVVQGIANTREALSDLGIEAGRTKGILGGLAKAGAGLAALEATTFVLDQLIAQLKTPIDTSTISRDLEALADGRVTDNLQDLSIWMDDIQDKAERDWNPLARLTPLDMSGFEDAERGLADIDSQLAALVESGNAEQAAAAFEQLQQKAAEAGLEGREFNNVFQEYSTALNNAGLDAPGAFLSDWAAAAGLAAGPTKELAGAQEDLGASSKGAAGKIRDLTAAMRDQRNAALSAFDAETQYREALKSATKQARDNSAGIDGNSKKALENRGALSQLAAAWNNQSAEVKNNTAKFREARGAFIQTAVAMGVPRDAAKALARELMEIPRSTVAKVKVDAGDSLPVIHGVINALSSVRDKTVHIRTIFERHNIDLDGRGGANREVADTNAPPLLGPQVQAERNIAAQLARMAKGNKFKGIGENIVRALVRGVNGSARQSEQAVERMMKAIKKALDDKKITEAAAKRMRETVNAMAREGDKLRGMLEQRLDFARNLKSAFSGELDLGSLLTAEGGFAGVGSITGNLAGMAARLRNFATQLTALRKAGIPRGLIAEIASLGSDQGSQIAASILSANGASQSVLSQAFNDFQAASGLAANAGANAVHGSVRDIKNEYHVTLNVHARAGTDPKDFGREVEKALLAVQRSEQRRLQFQATA